MDITIPPVTFRLAEVLDERAITVAAFSKKTGISTGCIGDLRTGKNSLPRRDTLAKICAALSVTPGDLIKCE
jgi:DNA-binding Xre family transcriptional regulator